MPFLNPEFIDPAITPYANCPTCRQLIRLSVENNTVFLQERKCPHCGIEIDEDEIIQSFLYQFITTQAVSAANNIMELDVAVIVFIAVGIFTYLTGSFMWFMLVMFFLPLVICLRWLRKFGKWRIDDEDFALSKKKVKLSLWLWGVAHVLYLVLLLLKFYRPIR